MLVSCIVKISYFVIGISCLLHCKLVLSALICAKKSWRQEGEGEKDEKRGQTDRDSLCLSLYVSVFASVYQSVHKVHWMRLSATLSIWKQTYGDFLYILVVI